MEIMLGRMHSTNQAFSMPICGTAGWWKKVLEVQKCALFGTVVDNPTALKLMHLPTSIYFAGPSNPSKLSFIHDSTVDKLASDVFPDEGSTFAYSAGAAVVNVLSWFPHHFP